MVANGVLVDAFSTDVRPLLAELRTEMGIDPDPVAAYARSGHAERARAERAGGGGSSWGG
jgi:L-rhamnose isomerase/sugar isomerase